MHSERIIADVIARFMFARMVANKDFDKLPAHVQDSYRADGVNLVRRLRETYRIERLDAVNAHPLAQIAAEEVNGKRFYELLSFRESLVADILQAARAVGHIEFGFLNSPGTLRALIMAVDRLDSVDARLKELAPQLTLKGARNAGETHPA